MTEHDVLQRPHGMEQRVDTQWAYINSWLRNQQNNQKNGSNKAWWSPVIAAVIVQHAFTTQTYKFADLSFHHQVHPRKAWPELWKQPHVICCTLSCFQAKPLIWTKCCAEKPCPILVPQKSKSDTDKAEQCYSCMVLPAARQSLTQRIQTAERWRHNIFAIMCKRHYEQTWDADLSKLFNYGARNGCLDHQSTALGSWARECCLLLQKKNITWEMPQGQQRACQQSWAGIMEWVKGTELTMSKIKLDLPLPLK